MASGGARSRSGPAPDPQALRRDRADDAGWTTLPAEGRPGRAPKWPLLGADAHSIVVSDDESGLVTEIVPAHAHERHKREIALWRAEWKRPQAVQWEANGQETEVAMYVRALAAAERGDAPTAVRTLVKQHQEALGISLPGLQRNRWRIAKAATQETAAAAPQRARFKVVQGGA